jgi:uncharacterized protein YjgD (DUF1641 family)
MGPFSLLQESLSNHWDKMMFQRVYWNLLMKGLLGLVTKFPTKVDLSQAQEVGLFGMLQAMRDKEIRQGLGVLL